MSLLLNNMLAPASSTQTTTPATNNSTILGQLGAARNAYATQGFPSVASPTPTPQAQSITGLLSPSHPTVGSIPVSSGIASHTVTTNPDNSVTSKVTYPNTPTTSSNPTLPQAPTAPDGSATTPETQYSSNGKSVGTQLPGMTGFNPPPPAPAPAPPTPTDGNPYIAPLANTAITGSPTAQSYTAQTAAYGAGNIPIGQQAQQIASQYGQEIANVGGKGAQFESGQLTGMGTNPVAQGNAAITAQTTAAQQQALATGEGAALQGIGYQLTGQNQAAAAANNAAGQATTAQGQTITGLNNAGSLAQPTPTTAGQPVFNPATGQYTTGGAGSGTPTTAPAGYSQADWDTIISNVANGVPNAISGLPSVLQAQAQAAAQAKNPNFNINTALGSATGQQAVGAAGGTAAAQNITTSGTAQTSSASSGYNSANQSYTNMSGLNTTANLQAKTVQDVLTKTGLNQNIPDANVAINSLGAKIGSDKVTSLVSAVTEMQNVYSQLLNSGGTTPTGSEAQALALLNPNSTASQINAAITQLQTAAYNKLQGQYQQVQQYYNQLQSTSGDSTGSTGTIKTPYGTINPNL